MAELVGALGAWGVQVLSSIAVWGGLTVMLFGVAKTALIPPALLFEVREARAGRRTSLVGQHRAGAFSSRTGVSVSVVVPAYNEGPTLARCVRSLLSSSLPPIEVVVVDDGSTDDTSEVLEGLALEDPRIIAIRQSNAGKGAALNRGIDATSGDVLLFVDADGIFDRDAVARIVAPLADSRVGAVCGDDRPVNVDRFQTRLLAVLNHAGTGLVRRALVMLRCLPIVSGNIGAFPRTVIEEVGGFDESTLGEDLELTWRVHRAGYRVEFAPRALVRAEAPSTPADLWRQRVRWGRGLIQTIRIHRHMIGNPRYGAFGIYLLINVVTMLVMPVGQLLVLACLPFAFLTGHAPFAWSAWSVVGWLGLAVSLATVGLAIAINGAWRDTRHLWTIVAWPVYSTLMGAVAAVALWREAVGRPPSWDKMVRTGVVTGLTDSAT